MRLTPTGIVPQGSELRAFVREGFADITGQRVQSTLAGFARVESTVADPGGANPDDGADEILEEFTFGGEAADSLEDTLTPGPNPRRIGARKWRLAFCRHPSTSRARAVPAATSTGKSPRALLRILSTDADLIRGGPNFVPSAEQPVIGGLINVRNLRIGVGARLQIIGSNTCTILATGEVDIRGTISVDGGDNIGVGTLNTTNQPEFGASGNAGGGTGGTASFRTAQSTPRGGPGFGAFESAGLGGEAARPATRRAASARRRTGAVPAAAGAVRP